MFFVLHSRRWRSPIWQELLQGTCYTGCS